jgi:hypothetical protein
MAFILVLSLHISKAYSFDDCQIVVLHVQSKDGAGMAALQALHGLRHDFFIIYRSFCVAVWIFVAFRRLLVAFCNCTMAGQKNRGRGNPLADVPCSC